MAESAANTLPTGTKVVVATSVMLTFVSFWRGAAIVLADLGSSAFYVGGIAEQAVGRAAPWFIFGVMLFSYAVRCVYVESCSMFTRGGVYRVVKEAMGGTMAKISVSALIFDYILTGPISAVSAGQYLLGLITQTISSLGVSWHPEKDLINHLAALIAILITLYFWRRNIRGIHESSTDALRIMIVATVMAVIMISWSTYTIATDPSKHRLPPAPVAENLSFHDDAIGWLKDLTPSLFEKEITTSETPPSSSPIRFGMAKGVGSLIALLGLLMAFGHSVLAMSGEETLAQVNRELEYPKHRNLMRAGLVIFAYSLLFTSLVSFFSYAIIPDAVRPQYFDNLISGIAMNLAGPLWLRLLFQAFIVLIGFLMLAGAVNTAIIGSNAVLNRVSEDGVLADWFRLPHHRFGTTYRTINMIALLQLATIIGSAGDVYVLGEAYAFGVVWSFAFNGLATLVLRFKNKSHREWRFPINFRLGKTEIPLGLGATALFLFIIAIINCLTKEVATIAGCSLTAVFFCLFIVSERINKRAKKATGQELDHFRTNVQDQLSREALAVRPDNILCLVRDYNQLAHLRRVLKENGRADRDIVVMTIHPTRGPIEGFSEHEVFTGYEQILFSRVISLAEHEGKQVHLLVVPSSDVFQAIVQSAIRLESSMIVCGRSSAITSRQLAHRIGEAWEEVPNKPRKEVLCQISSAESDVEEFSLGAHEPTLDSNDVELIHLLWLKMVKQRGNESLRHRDVVRIALEKLNQEVGKDGKTDPLNHRDSPLQ